MMFGGIVLVVVYAHDDRNVLALSWSGDNHFLGTGDEMAFASLGLGKQAGGFNDDLHAKRLPGEIGRILGTDHQNLLAVDDQHIVFEFIGRGFLRTDLTLESALGGIVLKE